MNQPSTASQHPEYLATLYEITRTLNSSLDLDEVLENVMDRVIEVTGAERGFLMLRDSIQAPLEFRVARGMDRGALEVPEFQVSTTIIRRVEQTREALLTDNAQFDERFTSGQSIMVLGLRSILCVPILVKERLIGLIYVDNRLQSGLFDEGHLALLTAFAAQAGTAIENARLYKIAVEKGRLEQELQLAHDIQRGLLPTSLPNFPGYDIAADWRSARQVAGDFYDWFVLPDGRLGVVVGDVSDKGAPAAIFMAVARSLIRSSAQTAATPEEALQHTNRLIAEDARAGMFVTVYYALLAPNGEVTGVSAGHNRPLLFRAAQGEFEYLPRGGRAIGWFDDLPVHADQRQMSPGDVLVLYTDGLTEAENLQAEPYGEARLTETVRRAVGQPAAEIVKRINTSVAQFRGAAPPFDDTTLVVIRRTGAGRPSLP